jgi:hypothetical protein
MESLTDEDVIKVVEGYIDEIMERDEYEFETIIRAMLKANSSKQL